MEMLDELLRVTFEYFRKEANPRNGLIADKNEPGAPSSIAAVGLGLSCYVAAADRGLFSRIEAIERILIVLRFFDGSCQGRQIDATG